MKLTIERDGSRFDVLQNPQPGAVEGRFTEPILSVIIKQHATQGILAIKVPVKYKDKEAAAVKKGDKQQEYHVYVQASNPVTVGAPLVTDGGEFNEKEAKAAIAYAEGLQKLKKEIETAKTATGKAQKDLKDLAAANKAAVASLTSDLVADVKLLEADIKEDPKTAVKKFRERYKASLKKIK